MRRVRWAFGVAILATLAVVLGGRAAGLNGSVWFAVLVGVVPTAPSLLVGQGAAAGARWSPRAAILTALTVWAAFVSTVWHSSSESDVALGLAVAFAATSVGTLLTALLTTVVRAGTWLVDRRRLAAGRPTIEESATARLEPLGSVGRAAVLLLIFSLFLLLTSLVTELPSDGLPSTPLLRGTALALRRLWVLTEGVAVSLMAGAVVLFVQSQAERQQDQRTAELTESSIPEGVPGPSQLSPPQEPSPTQRTHLGAAAVIGAGLLGLGLLAARRPR